jgi:hypothetical protein
MPLVSVREHDELRAVVLAFGRLERTVKNAINRQTRAELAPIWTDEVDRRLRTGMDRLVVGAGVRVKAGNPPVVQAAQSTRAIGKRLVPADQWQGWEFGYGDPKTHTATYTRRTKKGGRAGVTRHTARQMPPRRRQGRIAYPALTSAAPRLAALWVATVVRCVHQAAEGKEG